jgi:1,4-alpha-glucan branching enzyme
VSDTISHFAHVPKVRSDGRFLCVVLHAHLPFVRHPEFASSLEERWLYEAILECYLPLLRMLRRLHRDEVPVRLTMSITPPLAAMLGDPLLRARFETHVISLQRLLQAEAIRTKGDSQFAPIVAFYKETIDELFCLWQESRGDLLRAFREFVEAGQLCLLTCSATHAYLPGYLGDSSVLRTQLQMGMQLFESHLGYRTTGMWLPECAYHPGFDHELARAGVEFTVVDSHSLLRANPPSSQGVHGAIRSPNGVTFFARDPQASEQVWSREIGYPGDIYYRDFYRDVGFELPESLLEGHLGPAGRLMTGLKYWRITGKDDQGAELQKQPYMPGAALDRARAHAQHFVDARRAQLRECQLVGMAAPLVVAPYDAELFGHWWFEGPLFLEEVFRALSAQPHDEERIEPCTLQEYTKVGSVMPSTPLASSWGEGGFGKVWVGDAAASLWRHVHHASQMAQTAVARFREDGSPTMRKPILVQLARELLLMQSSDWAFILHTRTSTEYAHARFRMHYHRLQHLAFLADKSAREGGLSQADWGWLDDVRHRDAFVGKADEDALLRHL